MLDWEVCLDVLVWTAGILALGFAAIHLYLRVRYLDQIVRIFQERPLFVVPRGKPNPDAEDVRFPTADGLHLAGCYLPARGPRRGVILFGLEFGSNRWAAEQYCSALLDAGYDVFAYEPRNQGDSDRDETYAPLQWVTDRDLADGRAAVQYLKSRPDAPDDGFGVFGVSKGGSVLFALAAEKLGAKCVATDGAYATYTTMVPFMRRFVAIYSPRKKLLQKHLPSWVYGSIGMTAIWKVAAKRNVTFPPLERALGRVRQPVFIIHGGADNYIKPEMAQVLFERTRSEMKTFWLVPKAKHNQALHVAGDEYHSRLVAFFDEHLGSDAAAPDSGVLPGTGRPVETVAGS
ncbi:MAG: alpha/beta hydrolase [Fimbriiglobus sp.]